MSEIEKFINDKFKQYQQALESLKTNSGYPNKLLNVLSPFSHEHEQAVREMCAPFVSSVATGDGLTDTQSALQASEKLRTACSASAVALHQNSDAALKASQVLLHQVKMPTLNTEASNVATTTVTQHVGHLHQLVQKTYQSASPSLEGSTKNSDADVINQSLITAKTKASILSINPSSLSEVQNLQPKLGQLLADNQNCRQQLQNQLPRQQLEDIFSKLQGVQDFSDRAKLSDPSLVSSNDVSTQLDKLQAFDPRYQEKYIAPLQACNQQLQTMQQTLGTANNPMQYQPLLPARVAQQTQVIRGHLDTVLQSKAVFATAQQDRLSQAQQQLQQITQWQSDYTAQIKNRLFQQQPGMEQVNSLSNYQMQLQNIQTNLPDPGGFTVITTMHDAVSEQIQNNTDFFRNNTILKLHEKVQEISELASLLILVPELDEIKSAIAQLRNRLSFSSSSGSGNELVVSLGKISCSYGVGVSNVEALPKLGSVTEQPMLTIVEYAPFVNILPFMGCVSPEHPLAATGAPPPWPCMPLVASPWEEGAEKLFIGNIPVVTNSCKCECDFAAGQVSIVEPGQFSCTTK